MQNFATFYEQTYPGVVRALAMVSGDHHEAVDAAQEAFARALGAWQRVSHMQRPDGWVYVVGLNELRKRAHRSSRLLARLRANPTPTPHPASPEAATDLIAALRCLSRRERTAIVLRYYVDLPVSDIADAMQCRDGTVKATLHSAVMKLRRVFQEDLQLERKRVRR